MSYQLGKNILATITYYDVLDMPLTAFEVWKHLLAYDRDKPLENQSCTLGEVLRLLSAGQLFGKIEERNGFYFLPGRSALISARIAAEKISVVKLKRMRTLAKFIAYIPYVKMLGATGSVAMKNGTPLSDWDMFVVLRSGKIWIGRTLLTGILHCIGKRRHGKKINNRACLNYFVTDSNLEIGTKDLFSAHEYGFLTPFLNFQLFQTFELKNRWMRLYKPNFSLTVLPSLWSGAENFFSKRVQKFLERIFDTLNLEPWLSVWQKEKIKRNPKTFLEGSLIQANDQALIFLPHPRGPQVFQKFKERFSASP